MALAAEAYEDRHLEKIKLVQILLGKREPDVPFLKAAYQKPGIDPGFLLDHA